MKRRQRNRRTQMENLKVLKLIDQKTAGEVQNGREMQQGEKILNPKWLNIQLYAAQQSNNCIILGPQKKIERQEQEGGL